MCPGGGGGGSAPAAMTPEEEFQLFKLQEDYLLEQRLAQEERERIAALEQDRTDTQEFLVSRDAAYDNAYNTAMQDLVTKGLDPSVYEAQITNELDKVFASIPDNDPAPKTYFGDTSGTVLEDSLQQLLDDTYNQFNSNFGPGFAEQYIPNTADDQFITDFLNDQFGVGETQVQRQVDRGTLNPTGQEGALAALAKQRSAALGTLQDIGGGLLSGFRSDLEGRAADASTAIGISTLQNPFDVRGFQSGINTTAQEHLAGLSDKFAANLGDRNFVDIGSLINAGGTAQGPQNIAGLSGVLADNEKERAKQRGLGSQGVF